MPAGKGGRKARAPPVSFVGDSCNRKTGGVLLAGWQLLLGIWPVLCKNSSALIQRVRAVSCLIARRKFRIPKGHGHQHPKFCRSAFVSTDDNPCQSETTSCGRRREHTQTSESAWIHHVDTPVPPCSFVFQCVPPCSTFGAILRISAVEWNAEKHRRTPGNACNKLQNSYREFDSHTRLQFLFQ